MRYADTSWRWLAAITAMALALLALAALQTHWLNELRQAEQERALANLRRSAVRISAAIDREIFSLVRLSFRGPRMGRPQSGELESTELMARWAEWWEDRGSHSITRTVYFVEAEPGRRPVLRRFDPQESAFTAMEWPPDWAKVLRHIELVDHPPAGRRFPPFTGPMTTETPEALLFTFPYRQEPRATPNRWIVAELDRGKLIHDVLPKLIEESLGTEYQYSLVRRESGEILAGSGPIPNPDFSVPLFRLNGRGPGLVPGPGPGPQPPEGEPGPPGLWELRFRHEAGSVAQLAAASHRRNLWGILGVLAVMAAAMSMVVMNARRARMLARQQMDFVAAVSHELRTPIAAMRSAADNLADGLVRDETQVRRYGELLRSQGRQLGELVEQVLGFAGLAAYAPSREGKQADVPELVDQALSACAPMIISSSCEVEREVDPGLPKVAADDVWAGLALRNLVQNALLHGGGKWLRVEARQAGDGQPRVEIAIEDKGPGIEADDLQKIFDPFYRGKPAIRNAVRGAGLGLAIARKIAEAHGGALWAERRAGSGSRFILSLPAVKG